MVVQVFHVVAPDADLEHMDQHEPEGFPSSAIIMLWSSVTRPTHLIVRTEMQYFHIRFHMPLTSLD